MTVSSSTDFASTATVIITEARAALGINADEEPLSSYEQTRGLNKLTRMLRAWEADGISTDKLTEGTLTLVDTQESYSFAAGGDFTTVPFEITQIRIRRSGNDLEMRRISREDYYRLPNKTTAGYPTQWFYDRQRDSGTLYVWPAPDATAGSLRFTYRRRIMDLDNGSDNFDLPPEWEEALIYGLAKRMIPDYGVGGTPEAQQVLIDAERTYQTVKTFDTAVDGGSVTITPDTYGRYGGGW